MCISALRRNSTNRVTCKFRSHATPLGDFPVGLLFGSQDDGWWFYTSVDADGAIALATIKRFATTKAFPLALWEIAKALCQRADWKVFWL
jgi:hypothetical protein